MSTTISLQLYQLSNPTRLQLSATTEIPHQLNNIGVRPCSITLLHFFFFSSPSSSRVLPEQRAAGKYGTLKSWVGRLSEGAAEIKGGGGRGARQGRGTAQRSVQRKEERANQDVALLISWYEQTDPFLLHEYIYHGGGTWSMNVCVLHSCSTCVWNEAVGFDWCTWQKKSIKREGSTFWNCD